MQVESGEAQKGETLLFRKAFSSPLPKKQNKKKLYTAQQERTVFVSTASDFTTLLHPSGKASSPVITPLIVQGWQPFCGGDKRQRLQSNETWSESEDLWHQYLKCTQYQLQAAPHFCLLPLSVWRGIFYFFLISFSSACFVGCFAGGRPPGNKSQSDSLDGELSGSERGKKHAGPKGAEQIYSSAAV